MGFGKDEQTSSTTHSRYRRSDEQTKNNMFGQCGSGAIPDVAKLSETQIKALELIQLSLTKIINMNIVKIVNQIEVCNIILINLIIYQH